MTLNPCVNITAGPEKEEAVRLDIEINMRRTRQKEEEKRR